MSLKEYITSGVIEDYCLGLLSPDEMEEVARQAVIHPEIKERIEEYQSALIRFAEQFGDARFKKIKQRLMEMLDVLEAEENLSIKNLPLINKYSDAQPWLALAKSVLPQALEEPTLMHELRDTNGVNLFLVWTTADCPYEIHEDVYETLLLLEGKCICRVGDDAHHLSAGDTLVIPLHKYHNLEVVEGPVLLLVQRLDAA